MTDPLDQDSMAQARAVADAVLYEGYLLYPYRASAAKNRVRWQWGVLMPPSYVARGTGEHDRLRADVIVEPPSRASLHVRLRFLHHQRRIVQDGGENVPSLTVGDTDYTSFDEAVEREFDLVVRFADLLAKENLIPISVPAGIDVTPIPGTKDAQLVRHRSALDAEVWLRAVPLPGPFGGIRMQVVVANTSTWHGVDARPAALEHALIATHLLLSVPGGRFLSLVDPPEWASVVTRELANEHAWPVLVGDRDDTLLCSPIILYDHPTIAEQSQGQLYDGLEIDEILTLRTMTLTDEEKRAARATDPRAAELIDRVDGLPPELMDRLHGTIRYLRSVTGEPEPAPAVDAPWWDPGADASMSPETDTVLISGVAVGKGSRVRLRPGKGADAHDMFLAGKTAVVQAALLDVDGDWHLAVTLEDDLGAELYAQHGRYRYFRPDEVDPLTGADAP
jgi:hypothetical protein